MANLRPLFTWRSAICDSDLPATGKHIAISLSLYMSERGDSAFPGAARLAHDTGHSESTVRHWLGQLVGFGWLELAEKGGVKGERKRANAYRACVPLLLQDGSGTTPPAGRHDPSGTGSSPLLEPDPISYELPRTPSEIDSSEDGWDRPSQEELESARAVVPDLLKTIRERNGL